MTELVAYTDGACSGNPGPGGWGVVLIAQADDVIVKKKFLSGGSDLTTNNRMELTAAIEALKALRKPSKITIYTDSIYVKDGLTKWLKNWRKNGWKTSSGKPIKNEDLWEALEHQNQNHQVDWKWIKGHAGHLGNETADNLATSEANKRKNLVTKSG